MIPIEEMKRMRFRFLHRLYEVTGADTIKVVNRFELGEELGFDRDFTQKVMLYLLQEGLIKSYGGAGLIRITHPGLKAVEEALTHPDQATPYFPPVVNIISVGKMTQSQIQQAGAQAKQVTTINESHYGQVKELIESLKRSVDQLQLEPVPKCDLRADLETIEAQMSASKPKPSIITECLTSIKRVLEEAAGSALAVGFIETIKGLLQT